MKQPLFSCVIPVKGDRPYFDATIESLRIQGLGDELEVIIQDGTTKRDEVEGAERSESRRDAPSSREYTEYTENDLRGVRWYREEDCGQSDALNKGFAKAKGEWLFWLNADDILLPGALNKVSQLLHSSTPNSSTPPCWIAGDTVYIDAQGKVLEVRTDAKWRSWFGKTLSVWTGGPSAFFRRELWENRGGFDTDLKYAMDIDLWTRWAKAGERFVGLGDYVWGFRVHDESKTGSGRFAAEQAKELAAIDARYGVATMGFWRDLTRMASLLDGTWSKRRRDSKKMRGRELVSCKL